MYDCIIIGCGMAGMTASIYLARANLKCLIIEKETIGGQISSSPKVSNYPGCPDIKGASLVDNVFKQVEDLGVSFEIGTVLKVLDGDTKKVVTDNNTYFSKTIIIATGVSHRKLNLDNEDNLIGKGIHFCVTCDGAFYKGKDVIVVGGGNTALINAISLSSICKNVYIVQNLDKLTGEEKLIEEIKKISNIKILLSSKITKINGDDALSSVIINDKDTLKAEGMFISIGLEPCNDIFKGLINLTDDGYIKTDDCKTNVDGIFAAGDCTYKKVRQLTTATSDGTIAALQVINYLK